MASNTQLNENQIRAGAVALSSYKSAVVTPVSDSFGLTIELAGESDPPTGGYAVLDFGGGNVVNVPFNMTATALAAAISVFYPGTTGSGGPLPNAPIVITYASDASVPTPSISNSFLQSFEISVDTPTPSGGTFDLTNIGTGANNIPWNVSAALFTIICNAALNGQYTYASGGPLPGTPIEVGFTSGAIDSLDFDQTDLTGGTYTDSGSAYSFSRTVGAIPKTIGGVITLPKNKLQVGDIFTMTVEADVTTNPSGDDQLAGVMFLFDGTSVIDSTGGGHPTPLEMGQADDPPKYQVVSMGMKVLRANVDDPTLVDLAFLPSSGTQGSSFDLFGLQAFQNGSGSLGLTTTIPIATTDDTAGVIEGVDPTIVHTLAIQIEFASGELGCVLTPRSNILFRRHS